MRYNFHHTKNDTHVTRSILRRAAKFAVHIMVLRATPRHIQDDHSQLKGDIFPTHFLSLSFCQLFTPQNSSFFFPFFSNQS